MAQDALPQSLSDKLAEVVSLDVNAPEDELLAASLAAFRRNDLDEDEVRVGELLDEYRADGLAVVGLDDTLDALMKGQAEEVLIVGQAEKIDSEEASKESLSASPRRPY